MERGGAPSMCAYTRGGDILDGVRDGEDDSGLCRIMITDPPASGLTCVFGLVHYV